MPGPYHPKQSWNWFCKRPGYMLFMVRELTAVFIGGYLIFLIVMLSRLSEQQQFTDLLAAMRRNGRWTVLHAIALVAAIWHAVTWFNLTPKAMPIFVGENRVADPLCAIVMGYLPWAIVTIFILWYLWP